MGIKVVDEKVFGVGIPDTRGNVGLFCIIDGNPCPIVASIRIVMYKTLDTAIGLGYYAVMLYDNQVILTSFTRTVYKYNDIMHSKYIFPSFVDENGLKEEYKSEAVLRVKELVRKKYREKLERLNLPSMKYPKYDKWSEFYKDFIRNPEKCIIEIIEESS